MQSRARKQAGGSYQFRILHPSLRPIRSLAVAALKGIALFAAAFLGRYSMINSGLDSKLE
jgi:hypothetical protein